jgi:hypothetical protein
MSDPIRAASPITPELEALFAELPLERAMPDLVPGASASKEARRLATAAAASVSDPALRAGIWLFVDDLEASHTISQRIADPTGAYWHAIMHRREGDFSNSKYWLRQTARHPVMDGLGFDPVGFVDEVAARFRENPADLVDQQRREWRALFTWCSGGTSVR